MDQQSFLDIALDAGALKAAIIPVSDIVLNAAFRDVCQANTCGMFGRC